MRKRLREAYTPEELERVYAEKHDHSRFPDHVLRVDQTVEIGNRLIETWDVLGADLSAGDGAIAARLPQLTWTLGDYVPGYDLVGPIEETLEEIPLVDVFSLCETLEHLDDPDAILRKIRGKSKKLLLSTPLTPNGWKDENEEHYWSWDQDDVQSMLRHSNWTPIHFDRTKPKAGYIFQIWGCI